MESAHEDVRRPRNAKLPEKDVRHIVIKMLAGVYDPVPESFGQLFGQRGELNKLWPGAYDRDNLQFGFHHGEI